MTTRGGLVRKQAYLRTSDAEALDLEVARRRQEGRGEASESAVLRDLIRRHLPRAEAEASP